MTTTGEYIDRESLDSLRERYGLGQPIYVQYAKWVYGIITRGDFGQSMEWQMPVKNLIGPENQGWRITRGVMNAERSGMGSVALMTRDLDDTVKFCRSQRRGGRLLSEDPLVRNRLAEIACDLEACRALGYRLAWAQDAGVMGAVEASANKVFAGDLTARFGYIGNEIMGAYGQVRYSRWAPLKGYYEDRYQTTFAETVSAGTNEIQRNIIAWEGLGLPRMR